MTKTRIGYARCSTDSQDLDVQCAALIDLGVAEDRIYTVSASRARTARGPVWRRPLQQSAQATPS